MTRPESLLDRYRPIVGDWEAFSEANHAPEPVTLRVRAGAEGVRESLEEQGFRLSEVGTLPGWLRVEDGPHSVAQTLDHWLGRFHIQQAVMALPSLALAPEPGDRVLDMCAAPGGKTVHLAELMGERGCLVASDLKEKRLRGLMSNVFRLGIPNVLVIAADGRELPDDVRFDRVLVDAPCSAEGNYRRHRGRLPRRDEGFVRYITELQRSLLRRAIELVRPGGTVVYSTCTFAPEENEAVVQTVLDDAHLEDVEHPAPHAPGLVEWDGRHFDGTMERAWRLYPQHLDSGGAFVARLRRNADAGGRTPTGPPDDWSPIPDAFPGEDPGAARERIRVATSDLTDRFGVARSSLQQMGWMARGENLWVHTADEWPVDAWSDGAWRVVAVGLRSFRQDSAGRETPSNQFLTRFAELLGPQRQRVLDEAELATLLAGEPITDESLPAGPIVLRFRGWVLGRGMVGRGGLRHQIPRAQAERLEAMLQDGSSAS